MGSKEEKIKDLIKNMDLPAHRKSTFTPANITWLKKNMGLRNSNHPNYADAIAAINKMTSEQGHK